MYDKISTAELTRTEWLRLRKTGIGGSDAGAICGLNPYSSPMAVYRDKTSEEINEDDNEAMRQGRELEEYVARRFCEATGKKVRRAKMMFRDKECPWMIADIDRAVVGEDAILECKTTNAFGADKWKDGHIPEHYLIQCYHYLAVTGKKACYIAVVILGIGFLYQKIEREEEIIRDLRKVEADFWNEHVVPKVMPTPDGSKACDEVLEQYFGKSRKGSEILLVGFDEKLKRHEELAELSKQLETEKKQIEQELKLYMQDNERAVSDGFRVSWVPVDSSRIDTARLKEERPEVYKQFLKVSSSRRFQIRAA